VDAATARFNVYTAESKKMQVVLYELDKDIWYTYKIVVLDDIRMDNDTHGLSVSRKLRGAADSTYTALESGTGYWANSIPSGTSTGAIAIGAYLNSTHALNVPHFSFDNLQIREKVAYSNAPLSKSAATLFVETEEPTETVVMASYTGGRLVDVAFENLDGATNNAELSVTAGDDATRIFIWNGFAEGKPILGNPIEIQ